MFANEYHYYAPVEKALASNKAYTPPQLASDKASNKAYTPPQCSAPPLNYPRFLGLYVSCCQRAAGAEIQVGDCTSLVPSASLIKNSAALELRSYFDTSLTSYCQVRFSSRGNLALGLGVVPRDIHGFVFGLSPAFGITGNLDESRLRPYVSLGFTMSF